MIPDFEGTDCGVFYFYPGKPIFKGKGPGSDFFTKPNSIEELENQNVWHLSIWRK